MDPQEAVPSSDADDGSVFETERTINPKGDNSTDLSWSSTPVSCYCLQWHHPSNPSKKNFILNCPKLGEV